MNSAFLPYKVVGEFPRQPFC